jgi:hypothetical protein
LPTEAPTLGDVAPVRRLPARYRDEEELLLEVVGDGGGSSRELEAELAVVGTSDRHQRDRRAEEHGDRHSHGDEHQREHAAPRCSARTRDTCACETPAAAAMAFCGAPVAPSATIMARTSGETARVRTAELRERQRALRFPVMGVISCRW